MVLKAGSEGKSKFEVAAKGSAAGVADSLIAPWEFSASPAVFPLNDFPELWMGAPVQVELRASNGQCWRGVLDNELKSSAKLLKVK